METPNAKNVRKSLGWKSLICLSPDINLAIKVKLVLMIDFHVIRFF